jgi:hypothetical protein
MPVHPAILALIGVSLAVSALLALAGGFALGVLRHWDLSSGSERQLRLERRTYLIATLVVFAFGAELVSLLLFVYTAESLSDQFVGAMCATGVLNVNAWGWPTLLLKITLFFGGAVWLGLNRLDVQSPEYPLVRAKYGLLVGLVPLVWLEAGVQLAFFLNLDPAVIVSCCGALFSPAGQGVAAEVSSLPPAWGLILLYGAALPTLAAAGWARRQAGAGLPLAGMTLVHFGLALVALVSVIALYIYEHPHHHCPFCILKGGHDFIGYALYLPLFAATAWALTAGVIAPWRDHASLRALVPGEIRRLAGRSLLGLLLFHAIAAGAMLGSGLRMAGVWW